LNGTPDKSSGLQFKLLNPQPDPRSPTRNTFRTPESLLFSYIFQCFSVLSVVQSLILHLIAPSHLHIFAPSYFFASRKYCQALYLPIS